MGIEESFTSASTFPTKMLHTQILNNKGNIIPYHIQLSPTNKCNLNCSFCSCNDVDRKKELTYNQIVNILDISANYGTKAVTITGGGEPLLHPQIDNIIKYTDKKGIECGLVTNGTMFENLDQHNNLTWGRISCSDDRKHDVDILEYGIKKNPNTDWSFSYVVTSNPNYSNINTLLGFANKWYFSHMRLVSDLFDLENVPDMNEIKKNIHLDDSKIVYQGRKDSTLGTKDCFISLLKPVISPEGIFPCCGAQYAIHGQERKLINRLKMGNIEDLEIILQKQVPFDGSICDVCYYSQYNNAIKKKLNKPKHINFI